MEKEEEVTSPLKLPQPVSGSDSVLSSHEILVA